MEDDNFTKVTDADEAKPMGKLEKEALTYKKAYKKQKMNEYDVSQDV